MDKVRFLQVGFVAMFIMTMSMAFYVLMRPVDGASSTGTCLPISKGGTGCDPATARTYLGLGNLATMNSPLPVANGGTGATTAANARTGLGLGNIATRNVLDLYPVGSIYISTVNTNPGTYLGGTWSAFGQGRTLLGIGSNAANTVTTYGDAAAGAINRTTVEEMGGAVSHTLTIAQMPSHSHNPPIAVTYNGNAGNYRSLFATNSPFWSAGDANNAVTNTGGGGAHNNIQPYITVYFWKRTS
ncbi:hypothetical protein FWG95_00355 [Candidatus Saccharibacteria bacterium]|nr:hypothetical protein [Candidatus Saccharibacteria bacterium]